VLLASCCSLTLTHGRSARQGSGVILLIPSQSFVAPIRPQVSGFRALLQSKSIDPTFSKTPPKTHPGFFLAFFSLPRLFSRNKSRGSPGSGRLCLPLNTTPKPPALSDKGIYCALSARKTLGLLPFLLSCPPSSNSTFFFTFVSSYLPRFAPFLYLR